MGFCVLHYDKQTGSSPGLSQHIERGCYRDGEWVEWNPTNADTSRTYLNREFIEMNGSRDQRISNRIKNAGLKPRKDSVRALTLIMSASSEDMQRIMSEGKFDDWCAASIKWAQQTHGKDNVVSAVLHMDEKTPHLHVTIVPIVQGESKDQAYRRKKAEKDGEQKKTRKYKKKDPSTPRLCAADVMARTKLKSYQTSYAQVMEQFGLTRGIDGSLAKHVDINDWYKSLVTEIQQLESQKGQIKSEISDLESDKAIARARVEGAVKNTAKGVGEAIASVGKGVGKMFTEMGTYALPSKARDREKAAEKRADESARREKDAKAAQHKAESERDSMRMERDSALRDKDNYIAKYSHDIANVDHLNNTISSLRIGFKQLHGLIQDSAEIGLSALQTYELAKGNEIRVDSLPVVFKGKAYKMSSESGEFRLKFEKTLKIKAKEAWQSVKDWMIQAQNTIREWVRQQESPRRSRGVGR